MPRDSTASPIAGLSTNFRSLAFRRSFRVDPINTLGRVGIDTANMDRRLIDGLAELSPQELETLGDLQGRFEEFDDAAGFTGGIIF